ncbi:MAG: hypothetical protein RI973_740 [Bacteroidota bacterium]|jgi:hypothetical protein
MRFIICCLIFLGWVSMPAYFMEHMLTVTLCILGAAFLDFLWHLGKQIRPLDVLILSAVVSYLLSPAIMYSIGEDSWYIGFNTMAVSMETYFKVAFPGTIALIAGVHFPSKSGSFNHKETLVAIEAWLRNNQEVGIKLFWIGCAFNLMLPLVPGIISLPFVFGSLLIYAGGLYTFFSGHEKRAQYLTGMFLIPIVKSLKYGMFTELVFMGLFVTLMILMKYHVSLLKKVVVVVVGVIILLFIQSIKYEFRTRTWYDVNSSGLGARVDVFQDLLGDRVSNPAILYNNLMLSGVLDRTNQGSLTAMAIRYVPEYEPFAKGETIFGAIVASLVPRFLWPDKPRIGGVENMRRFTGFELAGPTSMDIGQLGDAYVNFGAWGGAAFLFFYGLIFNLITSRLFQVSSKSSPAILLWIPVFFAGCIQVESSVLSVFGHLSKVFLFYLGVKWAVKKYMKLDI